MWRNLLLATACGAASVFATAPAHAGTLQVNPVLVEISTDRRTATISIRNQESTPVTIRAFPLAWAQAADGDSYSDTNQVIVSPPVATIAPGAVQLVRVGLRQASAAPQAYRLIIEEVPEATPSAGIRVALRLNLPIYSMMAAGDPQALRWSARRLPDRSWQIEAENPGTGYVRLGADDALAATGLAVDNSVNFGTLLPGSRRRWQTSPETRVENAARLAQIQRTAANVATPQGSE